VFQPFIRTRHRAKIKGWFAAAWGSSAGPKPGFCPLDEAGTDRIAFDGAEHGQQVVVFLDGKRSEPALPDMAAAVIVLMVAPHMRGEQPHHVIAEFAVLLRPQYEVEMIGHQAITEQPHSRRALASLPQELDEGGEIAAFMKNSAAPVAPVEDMVTIAALGRACGARHEANYGDVHGRRHGKKYAVPNGM
jgi:hypothetical protein